MKFCKDCKHLRGGSMCRSPELGVNLVTGAVKELTAEGLRAMETKCGRGARWFEEKGTWELREVLPWLYNK